MTTTPDGVTLHLLPCGRTLVRDEHAPLPHRWRVLRPGWQQAVAVWDLDRHRKHDGYFYLSWWAAVVSSLCIVEVPAEELARLVALAGAEGN